MNDLSNKTEDLNLRMFNMITGINESKTLTEHNHVNVDKDLMKENVIQINGRIIINFDVSVKITMYLKNFVLGFYTQLWKWKIFRKYYNNSTIVCDEIIESNGKLNLKDDYKETKTNFKEGKEPVKHKIYIFH